MKEKNKILNKKREKATIAISQILILVIATIAFSWMIGGEVKVVSASDVCPDKCVGNIRNYGGQLKANPNLNNVDECVYQQESCPNGCSAGVCTPKTTTPPPARITLGNTLTTVSSIQTAANTKWGQKALTKIKNLFAKPTTQDLAKAPAKAIAKNGYSLSQFLFGKADTTTAAQGWTGVGGTSVVGSIGSIVVWSAVAFLMGRYVFGPLFGLNTQQSQALGYALMAGTAAGLIATSHAILGASVAAGGPIGLAIGAAVAFVMFAILYKKSSVDLIQYTCSQWEPASGKGLTEAQKTQRCKMCNDQKDFVCTEYQCRSLGQGCVLINDASKGTQLCIWNNTRDILPPTITPWKEALSKDFAYTPDSAIGPVSKGVRINYIGSQKVTTDGTAKCAPPFTPLSFGVKLDEPAKCKISPENAPSYAEMADAFMGEVTPQYTQSFTLPLPSAESLAALNNTVAENGGKYEMYVRCEDANGNTNVASFEFKFCISQGPDVTPPSMIGTSIIDNTPIKYNQSSMPVELYVTDQTFTKQNASCRWSHTDKNYNAMEFNMTCGHNILDNLNAQLAYTCNATLTGLKDNQDNKFYFRCVDDLGNADTQSYPLTLIGTQPLSIKSLGPKGIIKGPSEIVGVNLSVETAGGYDGGKAVCSFSETGNSGSYIDFFYGYDIEPFSQNIHSQELGLGEGNYTYFISCRDLGGNTAQGNASFSVIVDNSPPTVVRVYKDESSNALKIITDETAECVYSNFGCDYIFDNGTAMNTAEDGKEHDVQWNSALDFYIKCKDDFGNMPPEGECSIVARPFDILQTQ